MYICRYDCMLVSVGVGMCVCDMHHTCGLKCMRVLHQMMCLVLAAEDAGYYELVSGRWHEQKLHLPR